jgi:hypothetical protein
MQDYTLQYQSETVASTCGIRMGGVLRSVVSADETASAHLSIRNTFFEQAAHQNADGVVHLQRGDCGKAFHSFVATLTTLSHFRYCHLTQLPPEPPLTCSPRTPPATAAKTKNCKAIAVPFLEDIGFYIYNHAVIFSRRLHIGQEVHSDSTSSTSVLDYGRGSVQLDNISFCEAVAQFNLGLAYHQRGKQCGEDRTLIGALELYEQALTSLRSIAPRNSCETKILQLVVMNNRIHILNELARYQLAQNQVNELLVQSVDALASATTEGNGLAFITRTDIDNFLLNALVIRRFNTSPCA